MHQPGRSVTKGLCVPLRLDQGDQGRPWLWSQQTTHQPRRRNCLDTIMKRLPSVFEIGLTCQR
jgi:hypothetical protein